MIDERKNKFFLDFQRLHDPQNLQVTSILRLTSAALSYVWYKQMARTDTVGASRQNAKSNFVACFKANRFGVTLYAAGELDCACSLVGSSVRTLSFKRSLKLSVPRVQVSGVQLAGARSPGETTPHFTLVWSMCVCVCVFCFNRLFITLKRLERWAQICHVNSKVKHLNEIIILTVKTS